MWNAIYPYLAALLPTVAVSVLFYFIIKYILEGDRRERLAQSKWEREQRERGEGRPAIGAPSAAPADPAAPVDEETSPESPRSN